MIVILYQYGILALYGELMSVYIVLHLGSIHEIKDIFDQHLLLQKYKLM